MTAAMQQDDISYSIAASIMFLEDKAQLKSIRVTPYAPVLWT